MREAAHHTKLVDTVSYGGLDGLVDGPFSAVDPTQLVRSGLASDLTSQIERGPACSTRCCAPDRPQRSTSPPGPSARGAWPLLPPTASTTSSSRRQPPVRRRWPACNGAVAVHALGAVPYRGLHRRGAAGRPGARRRISSDRGARALRAQQLLADLAEIYFDSPDFPLARGVALVAPASWAPQPQFLSAVLKGLSSSPIVATVPIGQLFATVQPGDCQVPPGAVTGCSPAVRALASPTLNGGRLRHREPGRRSPQAARRSSPR